MMMNGDVSVSVSVSVSASPCVHPRFNRINSHAVWFHEKLCKLLIPKSRFKAVRLWISNHFNWSPTLNNITFMFITCIRMKLTPSLLAAFTASGRLLVIVAVTIDSKYFTIEGDGVVKWLHHTNLSQHTQLMWGSIHDINFLQRSSMREKEMKIEAKPVTRCSKLGIQLVFGNVNFSKMMAQ